MSGTWCVDTFFPAETASPEFGGVWSSGPNDVWAVAAQRRLAGGRQRLRLPLGRVRLVAAPISTAAGLNDVWGSGSSDVWIVGAQGATYHFGGAAWTPVATGATGTFNHVSGSGSSDVWAIGNAGL